MGSRYSSIDHDMTGFRTSTLVGVDLVSVTRFKRILSRYGDHFSSRVFTSYEMDVYGRSPLRLAARFAAKEAVGKALGVGLFHMAPNGIPATDIETRNSRSGRPILHLSNRAIMYAEELGVDDLNISLSHNSQFAIATVVGFLQNHLT